MIINFMIKIVNEKLKTNLDKHMCTIQFSIGMVCFVKGVLFVVHGQFWHKLNYFLFFQKIEKP
jgi:hypothetical protein